MRARGAWPGGGGGGGGVLAAPPELPQDCKGLCCLGSLSLRCAAIQPRPSRAHDQIGWPGMRLAGLAWAELVPCWRNLFQPSFPTQGQEGAAPRAGTPLNTLRRRRARLQCTGSTTAGGGAVRGKGDGDQRERGVRSALFTTSAHVHKTPRYPSLRRCARLAVRAHHFSVLPHASKYLAVQRLLRPPARGLEPDPAHFCCSVSGASGGTEIAERSAGAQAALRRIARQPLRVRRLTWRLASLSIRFGAAEKCQHSQLTAPGAGESPIRSTRCEGCQPQLFAVPFLRMRRRASPGAFACWDAGDTYSAGHVRERVRRRAHTGSSWDAAACRAA